MKRIYFKDQSGKLEFVETTDDIAKQIEECRREQWRNDAYEGYYTTSLEAITESGHEFEDGNADVEKCLIIKEEEAERRFLMGKLKKVIHRLTPLQKNTLKKLYLLNMSQADIAREEGVSEQAISDRIARTYKRLKILLKKS